MTSFNFPGLALDNSASGGGFRFLFNLKTALDSSLNYTSIENAETLLFNSHHWGSQLRHLPSILNRRNYRIILRIDGPLHIARSSKLDILLDFCIYLFAYFFADGIIFQSSWSRSKFFQKFPSLPIANAVIHNGVNQSVFFASFKTSSTPLSIVSTSWSPNPNKGFDRLSFLDQHLDFSRFNLSFCGNSPVSFDNINVLPPMSPNDLSLFYSSQHVYLQTSYVESCSNALLEAISSHLYPIVPSNSSHPELIPIYGSLYSSNDEILEILHQIISDQAFFCHNSASAQATYYNINNVASSYLQFANSTPISTKPYVRIKVFLIYIPFISYQILLRFSLFISRFR